MTKELYSIEFKRGDKWIPFKSNFTTEFSAKKILEEKQEWFPNIEFRIQKETYQLVTKEPVFTSIPTLRLEGFRKGQKKNIRNN